MYFGYFKLIVALHAGKLHQEGKVEWSVDMEDIVFLNMELLFDEPLTDFLSMPSSTCQTDRLAPLAALDLFLNLH